MAARTPYKPEQGSLAAKVCAYLHRHREEALALRDITSRWSVLAQPAAADLARAVRHRWLRQDDEARYCAGSELQPLDATYAGTPPPAGTQTPTPLQKRRQPAASIDPDTVPVQRAVPVPVHRFQPANSVYARLFARMQVGDMVELTDRQSLSFLAWAKKHKARVVTRTLEPGRRGIWRTA